MKFVISKQTSQDETLQCELTINNEGSQEVIETVLRRAFNVMDARLVEQGERVIAAEKHCAELDVSVRAAVNGVLGILFGRPGALQQMQLAKEAFQQAKNLPRQPTPEEIQTAKRVTEGVPS